MIVQCEFCGMSFDRIPAKVSRSQHQYCSFECMGNAQRKDPDNVSYEQLHNLYVGQQMSLTALAEHIGSSVWIVRRLLNAHGIPVRTRTDRAQVSWAQAPQDRREDAAKRLNDWRYDHLDQMRDYAHRAGISSQISQGPSGLERFFAEHLEAAGIEYISQFVVGEKFACDLGFPKYKLIVECDGLYWHSSDKAKKRDRSKDAYLRKCGFTVLRFTDELIYADPSRCIAEIRQHLRLHSQS